MAKNTNLLYCKVVTITEDYLGPAAKRFIDRQIENHLNKDPESITKADLAELNDWIVAVVSLLTEDEKVVSEYTNRLESLT